MKKVSILVFSLVFASSLFAQKWVEDMQNHEVNFFTVQSEFNKYWEGIEKQARKNNLKYRPGKSSLGYGWAQYKRWEAFWEPRVGPSGERPDPSILWKETQTASNKTAALGQNTGAWTAIGPFSAPINPGGWTGIGRINCLAFHPTNSNIVWAGAPAGGLWKSVTGGQTWTTNTDLLPNLGVSSIAIDPLHPDTMYISTGDRDGADTYSFGVLKSTDGGQTWNSTGLSWGITNFVRAGEIYINPTNTQILLVATRQGIYRSTNGGTNWTAVQAGGFHTLAADPQNPNKIFAGTISGGGKIYLSTDAGVTWSQLTSGLPSSGTRRVEIVVSEEDSNYVYALYGNNNNGFYGLYRSTNGGTTWTLRSNTPNLLDWSTTGSGTGGQAWYDLALAVNPTDKDQIFVGGVNIWRSNNGGASNSWTQVAHWYGGGGAPTVHADIHYFRYQPGTGDLFVGTDGGVYKTSNNGLSWTPYKSGMNITQYYKISQSESNAGLLLGGAQDNGTHRLSNTNWNLVRGGDGMDNAIDPDNNMIMYCSVYYGSFYKSTNGGQSFNAMNIPAAGSGNWVTPLLIDPTNSQIVYAGYDRLYRSTNKGATWSSTSGAINGQDNIDAIAVAPSNNQVIYVALNNDIYRSTNWGGTWTNVSGSLPGTSHISSITVSHNNPNHVWISRSGHVPGVKVYESLNGGNNWIDVSGSLPNLPVNVIVAEDNTPDGVYIGTDVGVYYRDATMSDWTPFMQGLPNVIVDDLEIHYSTGKIRAGTYGRGIWESDVYSNFVGQPVAKFGAQPYAVCSTSDTITLVDNSENSPTSWNWTIYPSNFTYVNGTSSTSQNPQVVFNSKGQYTVKLFVSNALGSDTKIKSRLIGVGGKELPLEESFESIAALNNWEIENPDGGITWTQTQVGGSAGGSKAMYMDFFNYSTTGQTDALISPPLSLIGYSNINLTFDHAYRRLDNGSNDSLNIYISTDCGQSWTLLQGFGENGSMNWATKGNSINAFVPTSSNDWCGSSGSASCKTINLNAYAGNDEVRIKFEAVNDYGNNLYLDNVNITGVPNAKPIADFIGDTTGCSVDTVHFADVSSSNPTSWSWSFPGGTPSSSSMQNPSVRYTTGGTYTVTLITSNGVGTDTIVKTSYVTIDQALTPTLSIAANKTTVCEGEQVTLSVNSTNQGSNPTYTWYRNGIFEQSTGSSSINVSNITNGDVFDCVLNSSISCITNDSVTSNQIPITVNPKPNVSLDPFALVCIGDDPFQLTGGLPAGGTYSGNGVTNGVFNPQSAGVGSHAITYSYTGSNGCEATAVRSVNVNNGPPKPTVTYNNLILKANPISSSYTYQWLDYSGSPIPGATDTAFIPWYVGDFYVQLTFVNGCTSVSDVYKVTVVGIDENNLENGLNLFPNPAKDVLNVELTMHTASDVNMRIMDVSGRVVYLKNSSLAIGIHTEKLDVENLAAGSYILEVNDGKNSVQRKFVKQ